DGSWEIDQERLDRLSSHRWRIRWGHKNLAPIFLDQDGACWFIPLKYQLLSLKRQRNLVARLQVQGFPNLIGYDQLTVGGKCCRAHAERLVRQFPHFFNPLWGSLRLGSANS